MKESNNSVITIACAPTNKQVTDYISICSVKEGDLLATVDGGVKEIKSINKFRSDVVINDGYDNREFIRDRYMVFKIETPEDLRQAALVIDEQQEAEAKRMQLAAQCNSEQIMDIVKKNWFLD